MLKFSVLLFIFFFPPAISAKEVPPELASKLAEAFLRESAEGFKKNSSLQLDRVNTGLSPGIFPAGKKSAGTPERLYVFNINQDQGFILISGDDNAIPVLGYSMSGSFDPANLPPNLRKWIQEYQKQIGYISGKKDTQSSFIKEQWSLLSGNGSSGLKKSASALSPLISTRWNQAPYYNDLCPYDEETESNSVTGCVATAMAQVMKYWNYPERGSGFHSYDHSRFGRLSANFGATQYNWDNMPDVLNGENLAVATLMYHCGVSVEMSYSGNSSGAYVTEAGSPIEHCTEFALKKYFGYPASLDGVWRDDYSGESWTQILKDELNSGRPVTYAGIGSGGGHAFVCDGYDENDFFHFNWGWGGFYDGYFAIDALDPSGVGTGGGDGGYNFDQHAIIGVQPPEAKADYKLVLYDDLVLSENPLFYGDPFSFQTNLANLGESPFSGDYSVAVFDMDNNFVEFADILEDYQLDGGMQYSNALEFSNEGSFSLLPGDYFASAFYRPSDGDWMQPDDTYFTNYLEMEVYYPGDIELYSELQAGDEGFITQNRAFTVTANILNDMDSTFTGEFEVNLYDLDGSYAAMVQTRTGAELEAGYYYEDVEFVSPGVSLEPGTYLLALMYKEDGAEWYLAGSSYYTNPVKLVVKQEPYNADIYENNDVEESAYPLQLTFNANNGVVSTPGSNIHTVEDFDYYSLDLEEGYNYSVSARVHDSYSDETGGDFSNDVLWSYTTGEGWSEVFDDEMNNSIEISDGGELIFGVASYFDGERGTYLLDIQVTRSEIVSTDEAINSGLTIFPVPVTDILKVESSQKISYIGVFDAYGRNVGQYESKGHYFSLDMKDMAPGVYFLHIKSGETVSVKKIVKQ